MEQKPLGAPGLEECLAASGGTKALITGNNVFQQIPGLLKNEYETQRVYIIADTNTMRATGDELEKMLVTDGIEIAGRYIFPGEPRLHAEYCHIETLKAVFAAARPMVPLAIGSGTINDLVKQAAGDISLPYFCIPTAASVDGFTSFGAAILKDGFKQTLPCDAPRCIVADTAVLSRAPAWLSSSGFADLAGKIIAGADWLIADAASAFGAVGADPIEPKAWAMVQHGLYDYLSRSVTAAQGDQDALKALFEALSITGFAMQYARDSRPVSGSEHLFAHVWEMDDLSVNGVPVTHGHKVAIGTLAATAFLEILFADANAPPLPSPSFKRLTLDQRIAEVTAAFQANSAALDSVIKTSIDKFPDPATVEKTCEGFRDTWKETCAKVMEQIMPYSELREMFVKAQCPVQPGEVNLTRTSVIDCARRAQMIRKRYNGLDLAMDLGCFETVLAKLEESKIYFV
jgi:glycerol-1-phosphate dehydrogenase [NAD(P)+]